MNQTTCNLLGTYSHSVDDKGRVVLPRKFREPFMSEAVLSLGDHGALMLYSAEEWAYRREELLNRLRTGDMAERDEVRRVLMHLEDIRLDKAGRIALPGELQKLAGITDQVQILGGITHVELWDPEAYQRVLGAPTGVNSEKAELNNEA